VAATAIPKATFFMGPPSKAVHLLATIFANSLLFEPGVATLQLPPVRTKRQFNPLYLVARVSFPKSPKCATFLCSFSKFAQECCAIATLPAALPIARHHAAQCSFVALGATKKGPEHWLRPTEFAFAGGTSVGEAGREKRRDPASPNL